MGLGIQGKMADALDQWKQDSVAKHVEAGGRRGSGSETEEHLAGLNDTNVRGIVGDVLRLRF